MNIHSINRNLCNQILILNLMKKVQETTVIIINESVINENENSKNYPIK